MVTYLILAVKINANWDKGRHIQDNWF